MAAKNWRGKSHPGLIWRFLFGHNGPTRARLRAELERKLRLSLSSDFEVQVRDPKTGRVGKQRWRIEPDGKVREVKTPSKKKSSTAKRPAAKKTTASRTASKPSKPSRTSKSGSTQQRRQPAATPTPRRTRAEPLADRVLRNPDGTLAGSRKQKPVTYAQAQREIAKAMRNAEAASKHAEELLEWDPPGRRRS
jgi:hypothetical protein